MAALAGATERLKFGMNVLALGFRDPLIVAKECATIDFLSGGRFFPGMGVGALTSPDWPATGTSTQGQGARTDEALEIMIRLWRGETVDFEGRWFRYRGAAILPLPVQQPMPLWLGGSSPAAIRRAARFGDGWHAGAESAEDVGPVVAAIKAAAIEAGRPMEDDHFGASFSYRFGPHDDPLAEARRAGYRKVFPGRDSRHVVVTGGAAEILQRLKDYEAAGITKFILRPAASGDADVFDQTERLIGEVIPAVHKRRVAA
jgi:alkanesulfonate monooxygenase SsuD/methylene tetrahydromethanopterin reductase-like flavin-dependent oxidoreductase (luciferase family)